MSLNKFMHPRNIYKDNPPCFKELSEMFPNFKKHLQHTNSGKSFVNFRDPNVVRCLSQCLLKKDFELNVELPNDRLAPTIPLRLNYILWLEDLIACLPKQETYCVLDIGCGSSCVYPLLGAQRNKTWNFIASELDERNFTFANLNVNKNSLSDRINVKKVDNDSPLLIVEEFDACVCNPPFYGSISELVDNPTRPIANSSCSGGKAELIGGDFLFAKRMIEESMKMKIKHKWYTIMLGKKSSFTKVKALLFQHKVVTKAFTEFCQGRTMRWGVAWSFVKINTAAIVNVRKTKRRKVMCFSSKFTSIEEALKAVKLLLQTREINFLEKENEFHLKGDICASWLNRKARRKQKFSVHEQCEEPKTKISKPDVSCSDDEDITCVLSLDFNQDEHVQIKITPATHMSDIINRFYMFIHEYLQMKI